MDRSLNDLGLDLTQKQLAEQEARDMLAKAEAFAVEANAARINAERALDDAVAAVRRGEAAAETLQQAGETVAERADREVSEYDASRRTTRAFSPEIDAILNDATPFEGMGNSSAGAPQPRHQ